MSLEHVPVELQEGKEEHLNQNSFLEAVEKIQCMHKNEMVLEKMIFHTKAKKLKLRAKFSLLETREEISCPSFSSEH